MIYKINNKNNIYQTDNVYYIEMMIKEIIESRISIKINEKTFNDIDSFTKYYKSYKMKYESELHDLLKDINIHREDKDGNKTHGYNFKNQLWISLNNYDEVFSSTLRRIDGFKFLNPDKKNYKNLEYYKIT